MQYIHFVNIVYGDSTNSLDNRNINEGFKGEKVYIVPTYTNDPEIAAMRFVSSIAPSEDSSGVDYSKGDGGGLYRYLDTCYDCFGNGPYVSSVYLSETKSGDGCTEDLIRERGSTPLYLCWKYADEEPGDGKVKCDM
ncbi:hypothetical protein DFH29DRAFT_946877 [Suillus ampliporus]|nr:hypothetical protein DFH29DRAFT_946877 [Suillus ampliporus]